MVDIRKQIFADPKSQMKQSWQWFDQNVRKPAVGMSTQKFLGDNQAHQSKKIMPGQMIAYGYDPKTKDTLPYYDTFPLCLPFSTDGKRFTAINLHYLAPRYRMILLDKLFNIKENSSLNDNKKINISWGIIKGFSDLPQTKHCAKQYLFGNIKSNFIIVPPSDWKFVIHLPIERFKKATNDMVWADTMRK